MELGKWQDSFAPRILERGENYYYDGAVYSMKWDGHKITATVGGTHDYKVTIEVSDGVVGEMSCTCPYADGDDCKHMAAVLFAASEDDFPGECAGRVLPEKLSLDEAVQALSESDAKAFLLDCAKASDDLADKILFKVTGGVDKAQVRQWMKELSGLSREYRGRRKYIPYERVSAYLDAVEELMCEKSSLLSDAGLPAEAFELTCKAWEEVWETDMEDADHEAEMFYSICASCWRDILPHTDDGQRRRMFDWILSHYHCNGDDGAAADEAIEDCLFGGYGQEAAFQEPEFLRRKLQLLDKQISDMSRYSPRLENYINKRLDIMRQLSMSDAEMSDFIQEHYNLPIVRQHLIEDATREEHFDDAIELLRRSKQIDTNYPRYISEYSGKLIALYQKLNRPKELRKELLYQMKNISQGSLTYVNLLKDMTPPEDWPELREQLLSAPNQGAVRMELMEQEGLYRRLLNEVLKSESLYTMDKFFKTLKREYPNELREFYANCLRPQMERASDRTAYAEIIQRLRKLCEISGGQEAAAALADEWRKAYPRRRAMLEELKKRGF